jgi:hypothetical protein
MKKAPHTFLPLIYLKHAQFSHPFLNLQEFKSHKLISACWIFTIGEKEFII